ncbi:MAG: alpha/beta hydrolase [Rhodothermales bacterium]|nr:alpha/beta hydrolase [Rhodothermales bacterium]
MDSDGQRTVVLLHGLIRSKGSMKRMERALEKEGYRVCNIGYPSTRYDIQELASDHVYPAVIACVGDGESKIDFVTHSLGGILVRQLADELLSERMGRVVMLSPPNGGSEVVDRIGDWWLFKALNGPAGTELGTESTSVPNQLGPPSFEVGIITGKRTINLINSIMIEGQDDGKVSVENARLEGMSDFLVLPVSHPFIMKNRRAIEATHRFLDTGHFAPVAGA